MKNILFSVLIALSLSACYDEWWHLEELPGEIVVTDPHLEPYLDIVQESVDGYNQHFTKPILHLKVDYKANKKCGRLYLMTMPGDKGGEATVVKGCKQYLEISRDHLDAGDGLRLIIQHEIGHGLGLMHNEDKNSIMYYMSVGYDKKTKKWHQHITDDNLQEIADYFGVELKK